MKNNPPLHFFKNNLSQFASDMYKAKFSDLYLVVDYCFALLDIPFRNERDPATAISNAEFLKKYGRKKWASYRKAAQTAEAAYGDESVEYLTETLKSALIQDAVNVIGLVKKWNPCPLLGGGGVGGGKRSKKILPKRK